MGSEDSGETARPGFSGAALHQCVSALQRRVCRLENLVAALSQPAPPRGQSDSDSHSSVSDIGFDCIWGSPNILPVLWDFCDAHSRARLLELSWDISSDQVRTQLHGWLLHRRLVPR